MAPGGVLVVGGQRSGKSRYAERLATDCGLARTYVATATPGDGEMAERIARHRDRRGGEWTTIEEPLDLPGALTRACRSEAVVLVDCLTLWLNNLFAAERDIEKESGRLVAALGRAAGPFILVSNEVGSGIVPANALARAYADALGTLNQRVAEAVARVVLVVAGLPLVLKPIKEENQVTP
jgi:adenosylcobinamide kinase/adenosylcobinamide-phosphate guanylyltransferase